jgi:uncharacterized protein (TIGR03086 family)
MNVVDQLQQATDGAATMIAALRPEELALPTPNEGWDVRAMLNHMIVVNKNFAFAVTGDGTRPAAGADHVGSDPTGSYRASVASALAAWRRPGALEGTVAMASGETPAHLACGAHFVDALQHVWDLSRATGRPYPFDPALCEAAFEVSRIRVTPDRRGPGKPYGPEVACAADAPIQDRLAAFLGRQP